MDNIKFDSKAEAARYVTLIKQQKKGEIKDLKVHVPFKIYNGIKYIPDFVYYKRLNGGWIIQVEDVKGVLTSVFLLKQKLFEGERRIKINIIKISTEIADTIIKAYLGEQSHSVIKNQNQEAGH